jgi:hypothetical protein
MCAGGALLFVPVLAGRTISTIVNEELLPKAVDNSKVRGNSKMGLLFKELFRGT